MRRRIKRGPLSRRRGFLGCVCKVALVTCFGFSGWAAESSEGIVTGRNPSEFNGAGRIDRIEGDQLVINDSVKQLSSDVKFYRPGRTPVKRSVFKPGVKVGYVTDARGRIVSLWQLP